MLYILIGLGIVTFFLILCSRPSITFLAGRNSVYYGIPKQVLAAAFNVDRQTLEELGRDEEIIFPSYRRKEQSRSRSHSQERSSRREQKKYYEERRGRGPQSPSKGEEGYWWEQALSYVM